MSTSKQIGIGIAAAVGAALLLRMFDRARQAQRAPAGAGYAAQVGGYTDERGQFRMVTVL